MGNIVISDVAKDLIINIINIIILFVIVRGLVYKPVKKFLKDRTDRIEKTKSDADELKVKAEAELEKYNKLLLDSKSQSDSIIEEAENKARSNANDIINTAKHKAEDITEKARTNIEKDRKNMLNSMKDDITKIAFDISGQILSREVDNSDTRKIAEKFFSNDSSEDKQ